jgi:hypothetical protein
MTLHTPDFVRVTIDGTDRTAYVISYGRHSTLCTFSDTFTLEISFEIPVIPDPYDSIVIRELYSGQNEKVIGGYIIDVIQDFDRGSYIINGQDKTLLLDDYFIHTQHYANNETVGYWMNWYASLVGLTIQYDSSVSQFTVDEGTPMGMITASEGIALLERLAAVYIKYDAELDKLRVFRITTSEPVINITNNSTTAFQRELGTDDSRNVVKVYGGYQHNIFTGKTTQVFASARANLGELIVDKTSVVANPHIKRTPVAQIVASRILEILDDVDDIVVVETAGFYPFVEVGDYASIDVGRGNFVYGSDREITDIQTSVTEEGAITIFTVGEKCPRVSILPPLSVVYATAQNAGVLVSWDGGDSFDPYSKGIVSTTNEAASGINGLSIAANKYGQTMAIVDNLLYKRSGKFGSWSQVTTLPDPSNDEGDYQFAVTNLNLVKAEKESSAYGRFHFLANATASGGIVPSGEERWWVYWTKDFGTNWNSMQLYVPGSGHPVGTPSGLPAGLYNGVGITQAQMQAVASISGSVTFNVIAHDLEGGKAGDITVLVEGEPSISAIPPNVSGTIESSYICYAYPSLVSPPRNPTMLTGWWDHVVGGFGAGTFIAETTSTFDSQGLMGNENTIFSIPNNTAYAICVPRPSTSNDRSIWRTTDGGDSWAECGPTSFISKDPTGFSEQTRTDPSLAVLVDYQSLNPDDPTMQNKIRFAIVGVQALDIGPPFQNASDETKNFVYIEAYFHEIDVTTTASGSMSSWAKQITYETTNWGGWVGNGTTRPVPRRPTQFDTTLADRNGGYYSFALFDNAIHDGSVGGEPRDLDENLNWGFYTIKVDFAARDFEVILENEVVHTFGTDALIASYNPSSKGSIRAVSTNGAVDRTVVGLWDNNNSAYTIRVNSSSNEVTTLSRTAPSSYHVWSGVEKQPFYGGGGLCYFYDASDATRATVSMLSNSYGISDITGDYDEWYISARLEPYNGYYLYRMEDIGGGYFGRELDRSHRSDGKDFHFVVSGLPHNSLATRTAFAFRTDVDGNFYNVASGNGL